MSKENNGGPAFPTDNEKQTGLSTWHYSGMSLRDYFAAKAMLFFCSEQSPERCAEFSYQYADAMLVERDK